jgi:hypothetical protein
MGRALSVALFAIAADCSFLICAHAVGIKGFVAIVTYLNEVTPYIPPQGYAKVEMSKANG